MGHKGDHRAPTELLTMLHLTLLFLSLLALLEEQGVLVCSKLVNSFLVQPRLYTALNCSCVLVGSTQRETLIENLFGYMINSMLLHTIIC